LGNEVRLVIVNYNNSTSRCRLKFDLDISNEEVVLSDILNETEYKRSKKEIIEKGLFVELKSFNSHIFSFTES
jgi:hypothetical protein